MGAESLKELKGAKKHVFCSSLLRLLCTTSECRQSISVLVLPGRVADLLPSPASVSLVSQSSGILQTCPNSRTIFLQILSITAATRSTHIVVANNNHSTLYYINNNNNNPICKAPECQKTSVALADRNSHAN